MRRRLPFVFLLALAVYFTACDDSAQLLDPNPDAVRWVTPAGCSDRGLDALAAPVVEPELAVLGTFANAIAVDGDVAFVVASGDNVVQRVPPDDPAAIDTSWGDLGSDRSPYDLALDDERVYVSNFLSSTVTALSRPDGSVLGEVDVVNSPQDLVHVGDVLVVASTRFGLDESEREQGYLTVLDAATLEVRGGVDTRWANPQFLLPWDDSLVVVESGTTGFDADSGVVSPTSAAGVEVFAIADLVAGGEPVSTAAIELGRSGLVGNAGRPARRGDQLWLGSGTAAALFVVDIADGTVLHGVEDPLVVAGDLTSNGLVSPYEGPGPLLTVLDFNGDALHVWDPACRKPVLEGLDLGRNGELLEGPLDLAIDGDGDAWIVMSIASALTRVRFPASIRE